MAQRSVDVPGSLSAATSIIDVIALSALVCIVHTGVDSIPELVEDVGSDLRSRSLKINPGGGT
jgi:hypothetical protein